MSRMNRGGVIDEANDVETIVMVGTDDEGDIRQPQGPLSSPSLPRSTMERLMYEPTIGSYEKVTPTCRMGK
jgi:hypothetical protein